MPGGAQEADHWENLVIPQHRVVLPPVRESSVWIESVDVDISIAEQVATTRVSIVLRNPSGRQQESQLLMPVPDGAAVRQFRLEGLPNEGIARVLRREEARRIYESIVRRTRDPGLIECASDEYFALADALARDGRQSVLAVSGEIYLLFEGHRTLITQMP